MAVGKGEEMATNVVGKESDLVSELARGTDAGTEASIRAVVRTLRMAGALRVHVKARIDTLRRRLAEAEAIEVEAASAYNHAVGGLQYLIDPAHDACPVDVNYWEVLASSVASARRRLAELP